MMGFLLFNSDSRTSRVMDSAVVTSLLLSYVNRPEAIAISPRCHSPTTRRSLPHSDLCVCVCVCVCVSPVQNVRRRTCDQFS